MYPCCEPGVSCLNFLTEVELGSQVTARISGHLATCWASCVILSQRHWTERACMQDCVRFEVVEEGLSLMSRFVYLKGMIHELIFI